MDAHDAAIPHLSLVRPQRHWAWTVAACSTNMFWNISLRSMAFSLIPAAMRDLGLGAQSGGQAAIVMNLAYVVALWLSGRLPLAARRVIWLGHLVTTAGIFAIWLLPGFAGTAAGLGLISLGGGFYLPRGISLMSRVISGGNGGSRFAMHEAGAKAGFVMGPLMAGLFLDLLGWRATLLTWHLAAAAVSAALLTQAEEVAPQPTRAAPATANTVASPVTPGAALGIAPGARVVLLLVAIGTGFYGVLLGFMSVLPVMLVEIAGMTTVQAAYLVAQVRMAGFIGLVAGPVADRVRSRYAVIFVLMAGGLAALLYLTFAGFRPGFVLALFLAVGVLQATSPVFFSALAAEGGSGGRRLYGTVNSSTQALGSVLLPTLLTPLVAAGLVGATFGVAAAAACCGVIGAWVLWRRRPGAPV